MLTTATRLFGTKTIYDDYTGTDLLIIYRSPWKGMAELDAVLREIDIAYKQARKVLYNAALAVKNNIRQDKPKVVEVIDCHRVIRQPKGRNRANKWI